MNENTRNKKKDEQFLCPICLNTKPVDKSRENKRNTSCPICQKICNVCNENVEYEKKHFKKDKSFKRTGKVVLEVTERVDRAIKTISKSVQTEQIDCDNSVTLLNEVLTVLQYKKTAREKSMAVKDASVSTDYIRRQNSQLTLSKIFLCSIDQNKASENGKYVVISSRIDDSKSKTDLMKHKSSSIPQMKMEELKYALKEKTKCKDVVEEVNRMFATVKRDYRTDELNRPSLRIGPRILPVVKTDDKLGENFKEMKTQNSNCKCCQASNMSSGDSVKYCQNEIEKGTQCCLKKDNKKNYKSVYQLCCHYKKCEMQKMICDECCTSTCEDAMTRTLADL